MDEFDLGGTFKSGTSELKSAKIILDIANQLKNKKIILIVHDETLNSPELMQELKQKFDIGITAIVRTDYLTPTEEKYLLDMTSLNKKEKNDFMDWAEGNTTAYLPLITNLAKKTKQFSFEELKQMALSNVTKGYNVAKITNQEAVQAIQKVLNGQKILGEYDNSMKENMRNTGLVGFRSGIYIIPPLVKEVVNKK